VGSERQIRSTVTELFGWRLSIPPHDCRESDFC